MTQVVPMHCGDPFFLEKQQTITNKQKKSSEELRNISSQSFVIERICCGFIFFLGLNFIFLCFKLIITHYHTPKQRKIKK